MAVSTVSSLSESFVPGAPEERSSGHVHKSKADASTSDETGGRAETISSDETGQSSMDDQHDESPQHVETQQPV
jgi:hypothetical protein